MLRETVGVMGDLPRLHEITSVFIRHGLGDIVRRIGIANVLERAGQILNWGAKVESERLMPATRLRMALEDLGPTFVKLGQVMATRVDLLPPAWIAELEKLHSEVPPSPFEALLPELERALGRSPFEVFRDLETTAQGSASIAQVHRAKLQDGTPVVLKIRRPGVRAKVDADLRILLRLAELIESEIPESRRYRPIEIAGQYARSLERELDLGIEARNLERFGTSFAGHPYVVIPKVYPEWTSETLNVQEHIVGIPGTDLAAVKAAGLDPKLLAARGANTILKMILVDGFFHADPHPGNVFYLPENRMAVIDFGMVGRLSPVRRNQVIDLMAGLARMDEDAMLDTLLDWAGDAVVDEAQLAADVNELVFEFEGMPLKDIRIGTLLRRFAAIIREHSIVMPSDLALMFKAMITMEGLGRQYDPDFHVLDHLAPLLRRAIAARYRPAGLMRRGRNALGTVRGRPDQRSARPRAAAAGRAPRQDAHRPRHQAARHLRQAARPQHRPRDHGHHDRVGRDRLVDRDDRAGRPAGVRDSVLMLLGFLGYALAFVNSVWVIIGIWRSGKA
jgi:ubiquinone biosynthesis protein